jgi:hypothetical protein
MGIASPVPIYTCHVPLGLASRVFSSLYMVVSPFRARCQRQAVSAADPRLSTQSERDLGPSLVAFTLSRGHTLLQRPSPEYGWVYVRTSDRHRSLHRCLHRRPFLSLLLSELVKP